MKKYVISYGDDKFASQLEFFRQTAIFSAFFDKILIFGPKDISDDFNKNISQISSVNKGGGYWLWKPYIIKKVLDELDEGDVLIYCDAGCMINSNGRERFDEYIQLLNDSASGTIDFQLPHKEYEYTKQEIFNHFNAGEAVINSDQLMSTVLILKKCPHSSILVETWYKTACDYPLLFTDALVVPQHQEFIDCRHDQSLYSVIRKIYGANIIPDETWFTDFLRFGRDYPFWATRLR